MSAIARGHWKQEAHGGSQLMESGNHQLLPACVMVALQLLLPSARAHAHDDPPESYVKFCTPRQEAGGITTCAHALEIGPADAH
jgi:hypothetical protein